MRFTGTTPGAAVAPPHDDARSDGRPGARRGRGSSTPHTIDDVPAGVIDALLQPPDLEPDRLDRGRSWLHRHRDRIDDSPTCEELARCILADAAGVPVG